MLGEWLDDILVGIRITDLARTHVHRVMAPGRTEGGRYILHGVP
jgi:hypothetical protein